MEHRLTIIRRHLAIYFLSFRGRSAQKAAWRELCRIIRHLGSGIIRPFAQNIWDLCPPVSVELRRGQDEKAWALPNTLGRILARVLHAETARMARCPLLARILHAETTRTACSPFARPKTAKTKTFQPQRCGLISISVITPCFQWILSLQSLLTIETRCRTPSVGMSRLR